MKSHSLVVRIVITLIQSTMQGVNTMSCKTSLKSIQYVDRCPRNSLEWDVRADLLNCSSINQTCVSTNMFLYHCVLNADGAKLLEVCAPYKYIYGQKCTEFDSVGTIIQENSNICSNASVPCPDVYISTDAYKYQSCYDRVQFMANERTTEEPTCSRSKAFNISLAVHSIAIILCIGYFLCLVNNRRTTNRLNHLPDALMQDKKKTEGTERLDDSASTSSV